MTANLKPVVTRSIFGRHRVSYTCPSCQERLRSPLKKAGSFDHCSVCRATFAVPGRNELKKLTEIERQRALEKARLEAFECRLSADLELLDHQLEKSFRIEKAHAEITITECRKRFEASSTEAFTKISLQGNIARANALIELSSMTAERINEIQEFDWPQALKNDAIAKLLEVRRQARAWIMKEVSA